MSQKTFLDTVIRLEALKKIFVFRLKIDHLQQVSPCFLAKNDQIFKPTLFTHLSL